MAVCLIIAPIFFVRVGLFLLIVGAIFDWCRRDIEDHMAIPMADAQESNVVTSVTGCAGHSYRLSIKQHKYYEQTESIYVALVAAAILLPHYVLAAPCTGRSGSQMGHHQHCNSET